MSRIGKKPIIIPKGVEIKIDGQLINVKGTKGNLQIEVPQLIKVERVDDQLVFSIANAEEKTTSALWGLARSLVNNAVVGVTNGFSKTLEINGVGFKAAMQGTKLILNVGFSHPVEYQAPDGIEISVDKNQITVSGIDKQKVGQVSAEIRKVKKPEPYKGKGIKYTEEIIRRKAGKVVKS